MRRFGQDANAARRRGHALVACVRDHDWTQPVRDPTIPVAHEELSELVAQARFHGVESCLFLSLRGRDDLDPASHRALEDPYFYALQMHMRARRALAEVSEILGRAGVPWLAFKGPALADTVYSRSDLRSYNDLDILVPPEAFEGAVEAFEGAGNDLLDRNWKSVRDNMHGQLHAHLSFDFTIDLHWNLINNSYFRSVFPIDTAGLFERSRSVVVGDVTARTLAPADTLVHLAVHGCRSGGHRLLWLKDLEQSVLHDTPSWADVIERAEEWRAGLAVATMLSRTQRALGVAIPKEVLHRLAPRAWRALTVGTDRLAPVEQSVGHDSLAMLVNYSVRSDGHTSLRDLEKRSWKWLRGARPLRVGQAREADPDRMPLLATPDGGPLDRAEYFAAVAAERPRSGR